MIYFTSDLHFGHKNIIKLCKEPFSSIEERDALIIKNWNSVVTDEDFVYVLGDISWYSTERTCELFSQLNGHIHIITGNHDSEDTLEALLEKKLIVDYKSYEELLNISKRKKICLFHYPIEEWNGWYRNSIHLHGHIHGTKFRTGRNRYDVGVNANNYTPVSLDCILEDCK